MGMGDHLGYLMPTIDTREARMLSAGRLTVTVTSKATNVHITLRLRSKAKRGSEWRTVPWAEATRVFVESYDGQGIATYYPQTGQVWWERKASRPAKWTTVALLRYLAGRNDRLEDVAYIDAEDICGKCGQPLTDPESIERGLGPICFGERTHGRAALAVA